MSQAAIGVAALMDTSKPLVSYYTGYSTERSYLGFLPTADRARILTSARPGLRVTGGTVSVTTPAAASSVWTSR